MDDDIGKQIKEAKEAIAEQKKAIAKLEARAAIRKQTAKLDTITQVRAEIAEVYKKYKISPAELKAYPVSYKFRNGRNRSNDENADWIQKYISGGGKLADLANNATQHDLNELNKLNKKGSRKKRAPKAAASGEFSPKQASGSKGAA